ncbi:hypothetical protein M3Y99_01272400 [Aphelenchoides fujianensis]|nr:hypothetical protein M3Y99_01272400 [Aphelenchoides fujianensis]
MEQTNINEYTRTWMGVDEEKSEKFDGKIDRPPAHSFSAFCSKGSAKKWSGRAVLPLLLASVLLVCLLIGGLLFEIGRLNGVIAGQNALFKRQDALVSEQKTEVARHGGPIEEEGGQRADERTNGRTK